MPASQWGNWLRRMTGRLAGIHARLVRQDTCKARVRSGGGALLMRWPAQFVASAPKRERSQPVP